MLNDLLDRAIDYVLYPLQFDIGTVRAVLHGKKILCEFHALTMYRGSNDHGDSQAHGGDHDGERNILFLDDFLPQIVGREFVDDEEAHPEDKYAKERVEQRIDEINRVQDFHEKLLVNYL